MKKDGTTLEQRGGKGLISIKFYPGLECSSLQPFVQADQGWMEILRTGIACKAMKHTANDVTVVLNCQDWAHRESLKNPIKRIFFLKFKTSVRADFFIEIWNEQFDEYDAHKTASLFRSSTTGLPDISEDVVHAKESATTAAMPTTADRSLEEINEDTNVDEDEDHGRYSDDDQFEETQPTTEPYRFELKRMWFFIDTLMNNNS